jgi:hypothetical protein
MIASTYRWAIMSIKSIKSKTFSHFTTSHFTHRLFFTSRLFAPSRLTIFSMDILWVKLIFLGFIFVVSILGGIVPFYADPRRRSFELFLQLGDAFAGGVFLSAGLIHMLPDSDDTLRDAWGESFPFGALFAVTAIYILFLSEKILEQTSLGSGGSGGSDGSCGSDAMADSKRSHSIIEYSRQAGIDTAKPILEQ